ncbi:MAG: hypothetical protein AAF438_18960 [Pseudomonadota bacterium]
MRNGKRHVVVERRYAIFPQQSGPLAIDPIVFEGQIISRGARPRVKRLRSEAVSLQVKPIPGSFTGQVWLPSQELTIEEEWSAGSSELVAGEPVTWTLMVRAKGLTSTQLPELALSWDDSINAYPDQPQLRDRVTNDGIVGEYTQKIALIATEAGDYQLPEVSLTWWNTITDQQEVAMVPPRAIRVTGDSVAQTQVAPPLIPSPAVEEPAGSAEAEPSSTDMRLSVWLLGIGWLATILAWLYTASTRRDTQTPEQGGESSNEHSLSQKQAQKGLKQACASNRAGLAKDHLLVLAKSLYPNQAIWSLDQLAQRYPEPLKNELVSLSMCLYRGDSQQWQGQGLWQAWQGAQHGQPSVETNTGQQPLHPLAESR